MPVFDIETDDAEGATRVRLIGDLDLAGFDHLDDVLERVQSSDHPDVLIDLRDLTFMDSSGLHAIVRAHERTRGGAGTLRLIPGSLAIQRLFALTGLEDRLEFVQPPPATR
jgi:anti-sigma B factor antagonist